MRLSRSESSLGASQSRNAHACVFFEADQAQLAATVIRAREFFAYGIWGR